MAQFFDPNTASGFGAFAHGLVGGVEKGQTARARQYALQKAADERENYEAYKSAMKGIDDTSVDPGVTTATTVGAPTMAGDTGPEATATPDVYAPLQRAYEAGTKLMDPAHRQAYMSALSARMTVLATPAIAAAGEALQKGDANAAADAMNAVGRMAGPGAKLTYKVKDGKVVDSGGNEVTEGHLSYLLNMAQHDPEKALTSLFAAKAAKTKEAQEQQQIDIAGKSQAAAEKYQQVLASVAERRVKVDEELAPAQRAMYYGATIDHLLPGAGAGGTGGMTDQQRFLQMEKIFKDAESSEPAVTQFFEDPKEAPANLSRQVASYASKVAGMNAANTDFETLQTVGSALWIVDNANVMTEQLNANKAKQWAMQNLSNISLDDQGNYYAVSRGKTLFLPPDLGANAMAVLRPKAASPEAPAAPASAPPAAAGSSTWYDPKAPIPKAIGAYDEWIRGGGLSAPPQEQEQPAMRRRPTPGVNPWTPGAPPPRR